MQTLKQIIILLLCLACITAQQVHAQSSSKFGSGKFGNDKGDTLSYRLLFPDSDTLRRYPLVIFLHGSGERGSDNEAQLKWGVMNFAADQNMIQHPAIVVAASAIARMPSIYHEASWARARADASSVGR